MAFGNSNQNGEVALFFHILPFRADGFSYPVTLRRDSSLLQNKAEAVPKKPYSNRPFFVNPADFFVHFVFQPVGFIPKNHKGEHKGAENTFEAASLYTKSMSFTILWEV